MHAFFCFGHLHAIWYIFTVIRFACDLIIVIHWVLRRYLSICKEIPTSNLHFTIYEVIIYMQPRKVINFLPHLFQKLISKNFSEEIRAAKDVETFLERPTLLLGLHETSLQGIVDKMLEKLISVIGGEDIDFEDARMAFFTHDSGKANVRYLSGF